MLVSIMTVTMALVPTVQASDITVKVNGEEIHPEMAPVIVEERTLVPLRAVSEALGCDVSWDADTKGIHFATEVICILLGLTKTMHLKLRQLRLKIQL